MTTRPRGHATFFLSTGRCATQWFANKLSHHFSDVVVAEHEPFHEEYQPRKLFQAFHTKEQVPLPKEIESHFDHIGRLIEHQNYIEVGWPAYGALPFLLRRFAGRVRVVHLYRHAIRVAASHSTHNFYGRGRWSDSLALTPHDQGVMQPELGGAAWQSMNEFEKCLFWWTELNLYALRLRKAFANTPWFSLQFEQAFGSESEQTLSELLDFLQLPRRASFLAEVTSKYDQCRLKTARVLNVDATERYPATIDLMSKFGYRVDQLDIEEIKRRYQEPFARRLRIKFKDLSRTLRRSVGLRRNRAA